jgi:predicted lysophospholipase L1 biosynthesis ABC-type transport system permease subunit
VDAARAIAVPFRVSLTQPVYLPARDAASRLGPFAFHAVSAGYFETMGTRVRRGRGITTADARDAPRVIVVSESMARSLWPGRDPLGQCVKVGADTAPCSEVVGVAQDVRTGSLTEAPAPQFYASIDQLGLTGGGLFVRTRGAAAAGVASLRRALQEVMPGAAYVRVTPLEEILAPVMRSWTLGATMFSVFGGLALLLATLGLHTVVAYDVAQRRQELAVRSALGAHAGHVVRLVLGEGVRLALAGVAVGTLLALVAGRWLAPLLFGTSAHDPAVFGGVVATLLAVAVLAGATPAWRAARVDPNLALRSD